MRLTMIGMVGILAVLLSVMGVFATCGDVVQEKSGVAVLFRQNVSYTSEVLLTVKAPENCTTTQPTIKFSPVNLTLGDVLPGEVQLAQTSVFVDTALRPDLDVPARVTFSNVDFVVEPLILKDGASCSVGCTDVVFENQTLSFTVSGFSNYSIQGRQDFKLSSDAEPVLGQKVYQMIDLGDGNRSTEFKCTVQLYGKNQNGVYVLLQTNPQRQVQARMFGSPDSNQPESLGYFRTENGIANVYFVGQSLVGYMNVEYVAQCASNQTKYVYEEPITTKYNDVGPGIAARGVWFVQSGNGLFIVLGILVMMVLVWLIAMFLRSVWHVLRGY